MVLVRMNDETRKYAQISKLMYLPQTLRDEEADRLGYRIEGQDEDRALLVPKDSSGEAVIGFRGTDTKTLKRTWRDVLTDVAVVFGKAEKTPRFVKSEEFLQSALQKGYKNIALTGHSLGGSQAVALGREYGAKTVAFNPAFGIPAIAKSAVQRIVERRKLPQLQLHTTWGDPISFGVMGSLTGKVVRHKRKAGLPAHAIENFVL